MVRSHKWHPQGSGFTCIACFEYTIDPTRKRKGCDPREGELTRISKQLDYINREMDKLDQKARRLNDLFF